jgi:predicted dehydrogenase
MTQAPVGVGIIGAGNISTEYLRSLTSYPDVRVAGIADIDVERAAAQGAAFGVPAMASVDALLAEPSVELIVNLTIPAVHAQVALQAIAAGKHVWGEKPLTLDRESARAVLDAAQAAGVLVGNSPDTVLGEAIQNSARLLADGAIGEPRTVLTLMQGPGPDLWHPRPQFLFARGAGPLFDIGPYYVTTLVQLLGPVASVEALGSRSRTTRTVVSGPDAGQEFPVEIDTHLSVLTRFESGAVGTSVYSFESPVERQLFEITGTDGTMEVPVSGFDGPTRVVAAPRAPEDRPATWQELRPGGVPRDRGAGALDMARAIRRGESPRASGELAYHVLDVMLAIEESAESGQPVRIDSTATPFAPVPDDWNPKESTL